jgi:hypothetical protein
MFYSNSNMSEKTIALKTAIDQAGFIITGAGTGLFYDNAGTFNGVTS